MCLIVLAYKQRDDYPLLLAGNRDEFYARPAAPLDWWQDHKQILAGRDLTAGGTWFGVTQGGKFAAVTNYREPGKEQQGKKSRGALVQNFLASDTPTAAYAQELVAAAVDYNGFNLVFGDGESVYYFSNRSPEPPRPLAAGLYGLSNHLLDTPWPKVTRAKAAFAAADPEKEAIFKILADRTIPPDGEIQQTGLSAKVEKALSAAFIAVEGYGTRASSFLTIDRNRETNFYERTFLNGIAAGDRHFVFRTPAASPAL